MHFLVHLLLNVNSPRLFGHNLWNDNGENAVLQASLDIFKLHPPWETESSLKLSNGAFADPVLEARLCSFLGLSRRCCLSGGTSRRLGSLGSLTLSTRINIFVFNAGFVVAGRFL